MEFLILSWDFLNTSTMKAIYRLMNESMLVVVLFLALFPVTSYGGGHHHQLSPVPTIQADTAGFRTFEGTVKDATTGEPLVFAGIYVIGTRIGTVSNSDGEFIIKIPAHLLDGNLGISSMGYEFRRVPVSSLKPVRNDFALALNPIIMPEIKVVYQDPALIIGKMLASVRANYSTSPVMMTSFYRETIRRNRAYVSVSEAVLDTYKSSYINDLEYDRVRILKGRKSIDKYRLDTLMMKLQGGPYTSFFLDVLKNRLDVFPEKFDEVYDYRMGGTVYVNDRPAFIIHFEQKPNIDDPLYKGRIFVDVDDLALVAIEFNVNEKHLEKATSQFIVKRPAGMNVALDGVNYIVKYRKVDDKWFLNYVRNELQLWVRWNRKLFRSNYTITSEMAVTDFSEEGVEKFRLREAVWSDDILVDEVSSFEDPAFWGEYNLIQPEQSIEVAIERLSRKLKRTQE